VAAITRPENITAKHKNAANDSSNVIVIPAASEVHGADGSANARTNGSAANAPAAAPAHHNQSVWPVRFT
jgi:hypothetical protein